MLHRIFIHLSLSYSIFFFVAASSQVSNFLATSCVAFLVKTVLHLQSSVFSHAELDRPIDWLPVTVVFEIEAHAVTRMMRILSFFAPNFGSPCCTQSSIIFSELNFHQEQLVELFVPGLLGDLVHQKKFL